MPNLQGWAQSEALLAEFESGRLIGTEVDTALAGYCGTGYVTSFDSASDAVEVDIEVPIKGVWQVVIRYASPFGEKGFDLAVDGQGAGGGLFEQTAEGKWAETSAGKLALSAGLHTLRINQGWGWYNVDQLRLTKVEVKAPLPVKSELGDPDASPEAKALFTWLQSIYGSYTITGQQMGGDKELNLILEATGKQPALRSYDFMDYSPSRRERGANPGEMTEQAVLWGRQGLVALSWHWNAPADLLDEPGKEWWAGFYTKATTFDVAAALADPDSERYQLLLRDIDAIAEELRKLSDAKVPVLFRPLHEASGRWFWWGAKGPEPFVKLWRLLYERLTVHHGLHNLIWVLSNGPSQPDWYPGDDVVDIVGWDQYKEGGASAAAGSGEWDELQTTFGGQKLVAMTENGTIPSPETMRVLEARWLWFCTWTGPYVADGVWNPQEALAAAYNDTDFLTLDELAEAGAPLAAISTAGSD